MLRFTLLLLSAITVAHPAPAQEAAPSSAPAEEAAPTAQEPEAMPPAPLRNDPSDLTGVWRGGIGCRDESVPNPEYVIQADGTVSYRRSIMQTFNQCGWSIKANIQYSPEKKLYSITYQMGDSDVISLAGDGQSFAIVARRVMGETFRVTPEIYVRCNGIKPETLPLEKLSATPHDGGVAFNTPDRLMSYAIAESNVEKIRKAAGLMKDINHYQVILPGTVSNTPLTTAIRAHQKAAFDELIRLKADPNVKIPAYPVLFHAACADEYDYVVALTEAGADTHYVHTDGKNLVESLEAVTGCAVHRNKTSKTLAYLRDRIKK